MSAAPRPVTSDAAHFAANIRTRFRYTPPDMAWNGEAVRLLLDYIAELEAERDAARADATSWAKVAREYEALAANAGLL